MLRRLSLALLSIFLIGSVASCKQPVISAARERKENENVLRYDVSAPLTSLNPAEVEGSGSNHIFPLLYSYLFVPNGKGELEPDLALRWTYDPESFTWTIHLREDALFHNGQPVTSKDVEYSLQAVGKNVCPALLPLIDRTFPLSDAVISIALKKNDPEFLQKIWDFEIFPQPGREKIDFYDHPVGSGPFRFKYRKGEKEVCLEPNEDYFRGRPSLDRVVFYFQPDKEKTWTRFLSRETDIVQQLSPKNYQMVKQHKKRYRFSLYTLHCYTILLYNTTDPLFSDPRVRLALSHAIDREYIVEKILRGFGRVAVGPMGVDSPYHNPEVKPIPYDPRKGLKLLKEAGWSYAEDGCYLKKGGESFEFTILVFEESQIEKKVAQYIRLCLNDLGIKVCLQSVTFEELQRRYCGNNEFEAVITEFRGAYRDPESLKEQWSSHPRKGPIAGSFEHPEVTRLIRKALDEKDPLRQKQLFYEIEALITSLQPGTFLFHKTAIDGMSKRFKMPVPFSLRYAGIWRLRYASLSQD